MGQNLSVKRDINHVLLAMNSRDLKRVMCGVMGTLEIFSQEVNHGQSQSLESMKVSDQIAYMRFAASNLLSNLDELLIALNVVCPAVAQCVPLAQAVKMDDRDLAHGDYAALRERWIHDLSRLPPNTWHM